MKFGRLTVIDFIERKNGKTYWKCICDCGNEKIVTSTNLTRTKESTKSCGCLVKEVRAKTTHGLSKTRLYHIYVQMLDRCYNHKGASYYNYGKRGICVSDDWRGQNGFLNFKEWAYKNGYSDSLSIDRIDFNGNYEPSNCRWADSVTQSNNTRRNRKITIDGITKNMAEWAREYGISQITFYSRVKEGKKGEELIAPVKKSKSSVKGIRWHKGHKRWEVYINRKFIGSSKNLDGAKKILDDYYNRND